MRFATILLLTLALAPSAAAGPAPAFEDFSAFYDAWTSWRVDSTHVARVQSLLLERDAGVFVLEEGRLALATPLGGSTCAAVFSGRGSFVFTPRSLVEREQVERFYGPGPLRRTFRAATFIFGDSTLRELRDVLRFEPDTIGSLGRAWLSTMPYRTTRLAQTARPIPVAISVLEGGDDGMFWAHLTQPDRNEPLFFMMNPASAERVQLSRRPEDDRQGLYRRHDTEIVSQFRALADPDTMRDNARREWEMSHVSLDATLAPDLSLDAGATITLQVRKRPRSWLAWWLPTELRIDSLSIDGAPQRFVQQEDTYMVWVRCDPPLEPGREHFMRVRYHGRILEREKDWVFHQGTTDWYPEPWYGSRATWDVRFRHPAPIQLLASGERIEDGVEGDTHVSRWVTRRPVPWCSFDVNFLRGIEVRDDGRLPVTVWMRRTDGAGRVRTATSHELEQDKSREARVAFDMARCLQFYRNAFGEPLARSFNAVETPLLRYEAFPGLIHMMLADDRRMLPPGAEYTPDVIRAHETAHQWWGLTVEPATYRDAWLSEGFADFCSIWYVQSARQDMKSYLRVLEDWRKRLVDNRKYLLGGGQEAGPIALGPRTNSSATPGDYNLVIYKKGAWVLHMLRNMLLDTNDSSEARFRAMMRDFHEEWRGRRATTADFRAAVERAVGEDMGWFFRQWIEGTAMPTYRVTWWTEEAEGGTWVVKARIEQSGVPDDFRAPVLVRVDFGDGKFSRQRVWVSGAVTELTLPRAPMKPTDFVFNDLESVLCEQQKPIRK